MTSTDLCNSSSFSKVRLFVLFDPLCLLLLLLLLLLRLWSTKRKKCALARYHTLDSGQSAARSILSSSCFVPSMREAAALVAASRHWLPLRQVVTARVARCLPRDNVARFGGTKLAPPAPGEAAAPAPVVAATPAAVAGAFSMPPKGESVDGECGCCLCHSSCRRSHGHSHLPPRCKDDSVSFKSFEKSCFCCY
jgi:hypothetical protein